MAKAVFTNDYSATAHPQILADLTAFGMQKFPGYGMDAICDEAEKLILDQCGIPGGAVRFLAGGTLINDLAIDLFLRPWQSVIATTDGHIATHEAGAIENSGHRVHTIPSHDGLMDPGELEATLLEWRDGGLREHVSAPGLVYISQPTELGTLYSRERLTAISEICHSFGVGLYVDGARLGYAMGSPANDVTFADLATLTDVFSIGGAKCGMMMGEALVLPDASKADYSLRAMMKIHGGLASKGWILGSQFRTMFADGLYLRITREATQRAQRIEQAFKDAGFEMLVDSPTNQLFPILPLEMAEDARERFAIEKWAPVADRLAVRFVISWSTTDEDEAALLQWIATSSAC